ncbi:MAG: RNA methyltransferase [Candidatus Symbiothrix sp.]|nr:RNA methyltransferase [Candidatus Symbiothrix sp.]
MLSKSKLKLIRSLEMKKFRNESGLFVAEGNKLVGEMLPVFACRLLLARPEWLAAHPAVAADEVIVAENGDIEKASLLKTPQDVLAVFVQACQQLDKRLIKNELSLVLDGIQDPGNLGTIVRIANWFGIRQVICSPDTADIYNPKAMQATMGGLSKVRVFYESLPEFLATFPDMPVYGAFLEGENIYTEKLSPKGFIVMGSEGKGIRQHLDPLITNRLYIPNYPLGAISTESLNVAVATAIVCSEFRRRQI